MRIGIIGAGHIGGALAQDFLAAGHEVAIANSRGPQTLRDLVAQLGSGAQALEAREVADFGEVLVETIPFGKVPELAALPLSGKVVIDTANYYPQRDGQIDLGGRSQSVWVAQQLPGARLVKAFNAIRASDLASQGDLGKPLDERRAIFLASDDAQAKATVGALVEGIGFAPLDLGTLAESTVFQTDGPLYGKDTTMRGALALLGRG